MDVENDVTVNATQNNASQSAYQQNVDNSSSSTHYTQNNLLIDNSVSADAGVAHVAMQTTAEAATIVATAASEVAAHVTDAATARAQAEATRQVAEERIKDVEHVERQAMSEKAATTAAAEHQLREERAAAAARQSSLEASANAQIAKNYQQCLEAVEEARAGTQRALDASARTEKKVDDLSIELKDSLATISSSLASLGEKKKSKNVAGSKSTSKTSESPSEPEKDPEPMWTCDNAKCNKLHAVDVSICHVCNEKESVRHIYTPPKKNCPTGWPCRLCRVVNWNNHRRCANCNGKRAKPVDDDNPTVYQRSSSSEA